jgi:16S rRNA (adenine1518-N6/adenine1519-N6)-dimethyltransferase
MSVGRMRALGLRPHRDLGQNFLVDPNILGVIERAAELTSADIVLEVGGGMGVLSEHLADRVGHVHVVEVDERLRGALADVAARHANISLHWGDAMTLDLAALSPPPGKLVANLPYGIAASLLLRTITELPPLHSWVAMVQREVGERLAAAPGSGTYGVPSVLAQLACEVRVVRTIPRTVFSPVPNVDSALVVMRRRADADAATDSVRALVAAAFAHRRKTLAGSLALARGAREYSRDRVRAALVELGHREDVRAERLAPDEFLSLARLLER